MQVKHFLLFFLAGCSTIRSHWALPVYPPQGIFCTNHPDENGKLPCEDIYTKSEVNGKYLDDTNNWVMMHPHDWKNIQNFIDQLRDKCD